MDDELQRRALGIAIQHPMVIGGSLEDSWDELWLSLGEELGSKFGRGTVAKGDMDALRTGIRVAVEIERRREAGWHSEIDKRTRKRSQALVAVAGLAPDEVFDVSRWVGPLLKEREGTAQERAERLAAPANEEEEEEDAGPPWARPPPSFRRGRTTSSLFPL